jgi:Transposase DDE domain
MIRDLLVNEDWQEVVERLGGAEALGRSARESKALVRRRRVGSAVELLRLVLAYCLGERGLRLTAGWAAATGLAQLSNVALLKRLQRCGDWLGLLVGQVLASRVPETSRGRLIRIIDATAVAKAGAPAKRGNGVWRVHSAFELPSERFGAFALTDETGSERLDRIAVVNGEIRIADRVYLHADHLAAVTEAGGDVVVRAGWKSARWLGGDGRPLDLPAELTSAASQGLIDRPIALARKGRHALELRLVAVRKSEQAAEAARRNARRAAQRGGHQVSRATLIAADWVILITSLPPESFSAADVLALYRLRWRIELGFKRLKSLIGLKGPPGEDPRSARPYILAHLLMILLLEPLIDELEDSPRSAIAA